MTLRGLPRLRFRMHWSDISHDIIDKDTPAHCRLYISLAQWPNLCNPLSLHSSRSAGVPLMQRHGTGLLRLPLFFGDRRRAYRHAYEFFLNGCGPNGGFLLTRNLNCVRVTQHAALPKPYYALDDSATHTQYSSTVLNSTLFSLD